MSIDIVNIPFDLDDDYYDIDCAPGISFQWFVSQNPNYLENLNNYISILYRTYDNLCSRRYSKLSADPEQQATAQRLGFGLLMRHGVEAISVDLAISSGIDASGKTAYERLNALRGQTISGYTREQENLLFLALDRTNGVAHPHIIGASPSYAELRDLYETSFRSLIQFHIQLTKRKDVKKYLTAITDCLDNFKCENSITYTLILGNLTRQLTECATNLWCYNNSLVPTDASTSENQITLSQSLMKLKSIAKGQINVGFGVSAMTLDMVKTLVELKNASNPIMHVTSDKISINSIRKHLHSMKSLRTSVNEECSPLALKMKIDVSTQKKVGLILTTYCGLLGGFGAHHFYAGNIAMGIFYLLTCGGFFIGPIVSLVRICLGTYRANKWGYIPKTHISTIALAIAFIALHVGLFFISISH